MNIKRVLIVVFASTLSACGTFYPGSDPKIMAEAIEEKNKLLEAVVSEWAPERAKKFDAWKLSHENSESLIRSLALETREGSISENSATSEESVVYSNLSRIEIWDGSYAPLMIAVPGGEFSIGGTDKLASDREVPRQQIKLSRPFFVSKYPITVGEFAYFARETGYKSETGIKGCLYNYFMWQIGAEHGWAYPGYAQSFDYPAVCINKHDATAYAAWLSEKTKQAYRLLTESEYEWAASGGRDSVYPWGDEFENGKANCSVRGTEGVKPVGSYEPNGFGLYDMVGGPMTFVADCYTEDYTVLPSDGRAVTSGKPAGGLVGRLTGTDKPNECLSSMRGGSWWVIGVSRYELYDCTNALRVSHRGFGNINSRNFAVGLRLARDIP